MEQEKVNWSARIGNATSSQMVLIIYELLFEAIDEAISELDLHKEEDYERTMERARKLLMELSHDLNLQTALEYDMLSLYLFVNKLFIQSYFKRSTEQLKQAKKILTNLYNGLLEAEKLLPKKEERVIKNAQQVYAGLTYGKGTLNESIDLDVNRGFKA